MWLNQCKLTHLHLFPNGDAIFDLGLFIAISILNVVCCSSMSHQLQARFGSSSTAVFSSPKGVTFARITLFSYCINHESNSTGKHVLYTTNHLESHRSSGSFSPRSDRALTICRLKLYEASCQSRTKIIFFFHRGNCQILPDYFLPPPQPNFLIFPNNREQNFRKYIIENNITEERTS